MKCGQAIIASVLDHGVDTVFGIPGGQTYELFDALYDEAHRVNLVTARHEQGAAYMAFGYTQVTGRVGVYTVVPGPGVFNTMAALSTAYARNAPVLCLVGQVPLQAIGRGIGYLHDVPDQSGVLERITKWTGFIAKPEEAVEKVVVAFRELRTGRSRPVALEIPIDVLAQRAEIALPTPEKPYSPIAPDPDRIKQAAQLLAGAKRPLIYIGGGAVDAGDELLTLAQLLQAPVVAQRGGRGVIDDRSCFSQTFPAGHRLWPQVDVVLGVGTRLKYPRLHWGVDAGLSIIHIDIDAAELNRISEPTVAIHGDAKLSVGALVAVLEGILKARESREEEFRALKINMRTQFERVQPQLAYLDVIRRELPEDGIFVDEITQVGYTSWYGFPVYSPRTFVSSGYSGNLGYGYATAIGAQVGQPERKVVAISGDGGFLFNSQELATAVKHDLNVVSIIFRDESFSNVARAQTLRYNGRVIGTDLRNPDFVKLAEAYGAIGFRVTSPEALAKALQRAFKETGPVVIEVPLRDTVNPWQFLLLPKTRSAGTATAA